MKTVLIHYKKWVEAPHPMLDGEFIECSQVVEVLKLTHLNDMFKNITNIEILSE